MSIEMLREKARSKLGRLPWQLVADSPTTKYYTDWRVFEEHLGDKGAKSSAEAKLVLDNHDTLLGCGESKYSGDGLRAYRWAEAPPEYRRLLGSLVEPVDKLRSLHYSSLSDAFFVELSGQGVYSLGLCSSPAHGWSSNHVVIVVRPGSSVSLVLDLGLAHAGSTVIEVIIGEEARANILTLGTPSSNIPHATIIAKLLLSGSRLYSASIYRSSAMHRVEENTKLMEQASYSHKGLAFGKESERIDYIANTVHYGRGSSSDVSLYGFALDKSTVSTRGLASIKETARQSSAIFEAEVLVIGDESRGYTMPLMEIDTGDVVEARHHAAQYRFSKTALFYMQSRGLSQDDAIELLIRERIATTISYTGLGKEVAKLVEDRVMGTTLGT